MTSPGAPPGSRQAAAPGSERSSWLSATFAALSVRNFRLFFIGQLVSNSGNWLTTVGITLLVLHRTGSGAAVGLLAACQFGPILLLSAWAGLVADRSNKRRLLYLTQTLEMIESFVLAALAFSHHAPLAAFFGTALAGGCLLAFDNPGRRSFVGEMVSREHLTNAVTLYSSLVALSRVIGPAVAGALVVTVGFGWCFAIDGASYLVVIAALILMRGEDLHPSERPARGRGQVRSGLRYVRSVPELWISFVMLLAIGLASYNFTVVMPLFVERGLSGSDTQYTLVYAAFSLGGFLGTLAVARRSAVTLRSNVTAAAAFGLSMVLLSFVPDVAVALLLAALVGGTSVAYTTANTAMVQLRSDRQMVGRVIALQTVLQLGTTPIGGPLLGVLADVAGGRAPVLLGGIVAAVAALAGLTLARRTGAYPTDPAATQDHFCVENS